MAGIVDVRSGGYPGGEAGRYVERIDSAVEAGVPGPGMKWRQAEYGPGI